MLGRRSLAPLSVVLALWLACAAPAGGVTWFTVNGQTGGTLAVPGQLVFRADTASTGGMLQVALGIDADQDGTLEPEERLLDPFCLRDGAYHDESAEARVVQFTRTMPGYYMWGRLGVVVIDQDGSLRQHGYQIAGPATAQTLSGTVRDSAGSPVAGALVAALPITFAGPEIGGYQAITAPDGAFTMQVPVGHYEVTAGQIEGGAICVPALQRVALGAGESRSLAFTLDKVSGGPDTISGTLVGPQGEPVAGHIVLATSPENDMRWTRSDAGGAYRLEVTPGQWSVRPHAVIFAGYWYAGPPAAVTVPPNQGDVDFALSTTTSVCSGTVVDEGGLPLPGATVIGTSTLTIAGTGTETNALGRYALHLADGAYTLDARAEGFATNYLGQGAFLVPPDVTQDLALRAKAVTVSGRVTRSDTGAGVPYVRIHADSLLPEWEGSFGSRSDAGGYYTLNLAPGTWMMHLESSLLGYWLFQEVDATASRSGVNFGMEMLNRPPVLGNGSVTPQSGPAGTTFTFQVTYTDADNWPPIQVYAILDGWPRLMQALNPSDTDYTDGVVFQCTAQPGAGPHTFSFGGIETVAYAPAHIVSLPASGSYSGPTVTATGAPQVSITSPANGATVKGTVTVTAAASDPDGIERVEFYDGATLRFTDTAAPYQWSWDTRPLSVAEGWHSISAKAYDTTAGSSQVSVALNVDNTIFDDVPKTSSQWPYVEALVREGISGGCSSVPPRYCPASGITRAQLAVFLVRAMGETPYDKATPTFQDVPKTNPAYGYIERIYQLGITGGCATAPLRYCPTASVNRSQMAVFLCRATGQAPLVPGTPTFADVPAGASFFGYVERLADAGSWGGTAVTTGCATGPPRLYCPYSPVTRGQMAVFLIRAFGIPL